MTNKESSDHSNSYRSSSRIRLFARNTSVYAIGNIGLRAASFLLIPLYTYSLSVSDYGLLATLLITIQIMLILMSMGMRITLLRFTKEYEDNNQIKDLLGTTTFVNFLGGGVVTVISLSFLLPVFRSVLYSENVYKFIILTCCAALMQSLSLHIMSYYRARNEAVKFMITGITAAALLFFSNFVLLGIFNLGIVGVLSANIATYALVLLFLSIDVLAKTGVGISLPLIPKLLRFGSPFIFSLSGQFVMGGASIYFVSYFAGLEVVAVYSLGYKLAQILGITTILPFQLAFQPYVFTNLNNPEIKEKISRLLTYLVLAITFMSFIILLGSRILLPLIAPPEYSSAFLVILLLLPGMAFIGIYYFGETLLSAVQKTYIIGFAMTICAIVSVLLNYMLIPVMNWYGAVIALNISFISVSFLLSIFTMKNFPMIIEWKRICITGGLMVFFLFGFFIIRNTNLVLFSMISLIVALLTIAVLFKFKFFSNDEVIAAKNLILKLR